MKEKQQYSKKLVTQASTEQIWAYLTLPVFTKQYMYHSEIVCSWIVGHPFSWHGTFMGQLVTTKGILIEYTPGISYKYSELQSGSLDEEVSFKITEITPHQRCLHLVADYYGNDFPTYETGWEAIVLPNLKRLLDSKKSVPN